jgi:hypothetical protein
MNKKTGKRAVGSPNRFTTKKLVELQAKLTTKTLANKVTRMIIMIAAAENNALGKNNELVWHLQMILSGLKPNIRSSHNNGNFEAFLDLYPIEHM